MRLPRLDGAPVVAAVVLVALAAAAARVTATGRASLVASDDALRRGDVTGAVVEARRAARSYLPGAAHVGRAYDRLRSVAADAEAHGDRDTALFAWRAARSAAIATRWGFDPAASERASADAALARLSSSAAPPTALRDRSPADLERLYASLLADETASSGPRAGYAAAGLLLCVAGVFAFVRRGFDASGALRARLAWPALLVAAAGLALWLGALARV